MSPLKLNGSTSGFVALDAPAAAGSNTLVLPTGNGSANQLLKNSATAGTLAFSSMVETTTGVGIGTTSPATTLEVVGAVRVSGNANLPAQTNTNAVLAGGFASPESGRLFIGDGTGWKFLFSTRTGSVTSDKYSFGDTGTFEIKADSSVAPFIAKINNTERMRITSLGALEITFTDGGNEAQIIDRTTADGTLIKFKQAGTTEGEIYVNGTTVTYGGGHLARWSQLPNDEDPSTLLKGTVLSNLDEMCEWGEEANEQLNKTKVSDVEGDPNVAGVFVATSPSEDGPLDFFVGMTGDMIIRIAEGVTVERGDLLMSAGDGTAKPQDDDIIRSKTIAKVTSTHVTCTYDDGSYCVPCVLMAC